MTYSRRHALRLMAASSLGVAGAMSFPRVQTAAAADTQGYKALVCVFLFGGLDCHDLLIPYDNESYTSYAGVRQSLLNAYGETRDRSQLLALSPDNASDFGSRQFALPPEMPGLKGLFEQGRAAFIANVGPLLEPVTAQSFADGSARVPSRLFSHNDQQSTWQASAPEGALLGWGGLFADAAIASGANGTRPEFTTLATAGVGPFLTGDMASPYQVSTSSSAGINILQGDAALANFLTAAENRFRADAFNGSHILERDIARMFQKGIDSNNIFDAARANAISLATPFPESGLGAQLRTVAETISIRSALSASRQIFFVGIGGFDSHSTQAVDLPPLLTQIDGALSAFDDAITELGLSDSVTTFTASDFGRTLAVNGDGTDHGWGGHQIVMGGAVRGRRIYGRMPAARFGHDNDGGGGRLIPSLSIEQFADPLGQWWGLTPDETATALPNLRNFENAGLALFR